MKLYRQSIDQKDSDEKVEGIQRPAKKTGADRVPLLGSERGSRGTGGGHGRVVER